MVRRNVEFLKLKIKYWCSSPNTGTSPPSDPASGSLRTESQLREAISTMQLFGGLEPTGLIDEATVELMRRRRCGVSDVIPGGSYRMKRYAIQGQKWPGTNLTWR
ncbi:matrix metalloproteinase-17 [Caerostris extrusa]|uniref:Matrix metalloproteinase-17 n=1 Tax=Caerostris extrusa TaxID=172846 RepID=A0AAV4XXB8_CAEEX|nr:matrix metalloproteinase-17 [Caerostris extrusa]